jgi:hypothetical protein
MRTINLNMINVNNTLNTVMVLNTLCIRHSEGFHDLTTL